MHATYISHYYEEEAGPLKSISIHPREEAREILGQLAKGEGYNSKSRPPAYIDWRIDVENWLREAFIKKGGQPKRQHPHYFVLGHCDWLLGWYKNGRVLKLSLEDIDPMQISITYPDSMVWYMLHQYHLLNNNPYYKKSEHREYHGQVYLLKELESIISKYGTPKGEVRNGQPDHDMYIEVQVWDEIGLLY